MFNIIFNTTLVFIKLLFCNKLIKKHSKKLLVYYILLYFKNVWAFRLKILTIFYLITLLLIIVNNFFSFTRILRIKRRLI